MSSYHRRTCVIKKMGTIKYIVIHCTATDREAKVAFIVRYWKKKLKWKNAGYHFIVDQNGGVTMLQPLHKPSNGVRGYNTSSIHISYIGGIDRNGKPQDTRTQTQYVVIAALIKALQGAYPDAAVLGHGDFPKVKKACPSFEVSTFLKEIA